MKIEIKHRRIDAVLFSCDLPAKVAELEHRLQLGFAVKQAVEAHADLACANLTHADLTEASLTGADLTDANLTRATLVYADLAGASLAYANLAGANLTGADLTCADLADANLAGADFEVASLACANLAGADLTQANLADANLTGADLAYASLAGANLTGANVDSFRQDLIVEGLKLPNELEALRSAIIEGRLEDYSGQNTGSFYADPDSPRACWFTMIKPGDTPATSPASKLALSWLDEAIAIRENIRAERKL